MYSMKLVTLNLAILFVNIVWSKIPWKLCEYATSDKYVGHYEHENGEAKIIPIYENQENTKKICENKCRINNTCFAISFDNFNTCSFYSTSHFHVIQSVTGKQYSRWIACDMSKGYQPADGRCFGLWVTYKNMFITVNSYIILANVYTDKNRCRNKCLKNSLCGFIYRHNGICKLIPKWPYRNVHMSTNVSIPGVTDIWTCVDGFVGKLQIDQSQYKPNKYKCTGYWSILSRNASLLSYKHIGLNFHTQSYKACLEECNQYTKCRRVYYNETYSFCILDNIENSDNILPYKHTTFILFEWKCTKSDSCYPQLNGKEKKYLKSGMNCLRIMNNRNLFIAKDICGNFPNRSSFTKCIEIKEKHDWNIIDSCLVNQSYWSYSRKTIPLNISDHGFMNVTKIFTGLQLYWLAYLSDENLMNVSYLECRIFNASQSTVSLNSKLIISTKEWQAQPARGSKRLFKREPHSFSISSSEQPIHSCKTRAAGMDIMRWLQVLYFNGSGKSGKYSDVPFNFMIDENGNIYEGRGWRHQCAAVGAYNERAICVAYIGWFAYKLPGVAFLENVKILIKFAVDHGIMSSDYNLYIQQDLGISQAGRNLVIVIKNWYRYKGFLPENCNNISFLIILLNFVTFILIILPIFFSYKIFTFKPCCKKCNFLHKKLAVKFKPIFPIPSNDYGSDRQEFVDRKYNINVIIYEKSGIIFKKDHLNIVKMLRLWFFNQCLETMNARFVENSICNFINSFTNHDIHGMVYEADLFQIEDVKSINPKILICVPTSSSINFLNTMIKTNSCICLYFTIQYIDRSTLFSEIALIKE